MTESNLSKVNIGILVYDIDFDVRDNYGKEFKFFLSSGFVKWIESAGARVTPIWADKDDKYYKEILSKVNGVLFPAGKFWFNDKTGNGQACYSAKKIYDIAKEMNDKGIYFPIWGISLGFELFFYAASGGKTESRVSIEKYAGNFPLTFESGYEKSKLFGNKEISNDILNLLKHDKVNYYYNIFAVTKQEEEWNVLSTAVSGDVKFITSAEHKKYPFYGVMSQVHRVQFENFPKNVTHSTAAIKVSEYYANFFITEARKNKNSFNGDELQHSIYNFPITFTEPKVPSHVACYLFDKNTDYPK